MKTKIIGWLYVIGSPILIFAGVLSILMTGNTFSDSAARQNSLIYGILALGLGLFSFFWGSALRRHKAWSWRVGKIVIPIISATTAIYLVYAFSWANVAALAFQIFVIYSLFSEKHLFLTQEANPSANP